MVSNVGTRPNHYELLGLEPTASDDEIAQAFAREMSLFRPHTFGGLAELSVAYGVLRDPVRRRTYDESLRPPAPAPKPVQEEREWAPFMIRASAHPAERRSIDPLHLPAQAVPEPAPPPEPSVDARLAAITASLRELAKPGSLNATKAPEPLAELPPLRAEAEVQADEADDVRFEWRRPALIAGGLVLGVALIGAGAGVMAGNDAEAEQPQKALTIAVPPARAHPTTDSTEAPVWAEAEPRREGRATAVKARSARFRPAPQRALSDKELDELAPVEVGAKATEPAQITTEQAAADFSRASATPAKMPLPNSVIARTIGRIGYSCGQVASVVAGDGTGVYQVTCTSGQSYRAAPVRGRYHFSKAGR